MSTAGGAGGETSLFSVFRSLPRAYLPLSLFLSFCLLPIAQASSCFPRLYLLLGRNFPKSIFDRKSKISCSRLLASFSHVSGTRPHTPPLNELMQRRWRICLSVNRACFCVRQWTIDVLLEICRSNRDVSSAAVYPFPSRELAPQCASCLSTCARSP